MHVCKIDAWLCKSVGYHRVNFGSNHAQPLFWGMDNVRRRSRFLFRPALFCLEERNAPLGHDIGEPGAALMPLGIGNALESEIAPSRLAWINHNRLAEFPAPVSTANETLEYDAPAGAYPSALASAACSREDRPTASPITTPAIPNWDFNQAESFGDDAISVIIVLAPRVDRPDSGGTSQAEIV